MFLWPPLLLGACCYLEPVAICLSRPPSRTMRQLRQDCPHDPLSAQGTLASTTGLAEELWLSAAGSCSAAVAAAARAQPARNSLGEGEGEATGDQVGRGGWLVVAGS